MVERLIVEEPGNTAPGGQQTQPPSRRLSVKPASRRRVADPRLDHIARLAAEWKRELEKCLDDPGSETVHRIRTGTRRVEAMIDVLMREAAEANPVLGDAAARWRRELKKIRRAAGPVRDLDVHRQLIATFDSIVKARERARIQPSEPGQQAAPPESRDPLETQAERLDAWLRHAREQRSGEMAKQITKRVVKLDGLAAAFAEAWQTRHGRGRPIRKPALAALDSFVALSDEMPMLDASNLHDFRKRAKKARYVTEAGGNDAHAKAVGRAIKKIQDAIGEWHDRVCLAEEAQIALGEEGTELRAMLEAEKVKSYLLAKRVTERMRGKLVGEWRALHPK